MNEEEMTDTDAVSDGTAGAASSPEGGGEAGHRAQAHLRVQWALEDLLASSGARDPEDLRMLLAVDARDIPSDEGVAPDLSAVRGRIAQLKREKQYLFSVGDGTAAGASGVRFAPEGHVDERMLSDEEFYRRKMAVMTRRRR